MITKTIFAKTSFSSTDGKTERRARDFKTILGARFPIFQGVGQQDAHEFLCAAFDALEAEAEACIAMGAKARAHIQRHRHATIVAAFPWDATVV